ncbi:MAG TPA: protein-L-isoaspartate(D-aspartate) O-methyltransferase [Geminicoccaceae bacterium]|nr:protein-L-isoaspartate(D-aspartate) O-methyltransferase [Geminicoccaceae bacterium]
MAQDATRPPDDADEAVAARRALLETIAEEIRWTGIGDGRRELDPRVRAAIAKVPRERFVPPDLKAHAHDNRPLPIGHGQTISQPLIVAVMTDLLRLQPSSRVLEVGTGSGYQTAILAELAGAVVTVEVVEALAAAARVRLKALGYRNIAFRTGDGAVGCPEEAPFDAILVAAAAPSIPRALLEQLRPGGRLVIPLGRDPLSQELVLVEKDAAGRSDERSLFPVAFVPLRSGRPAPP